MLDWKIILQKEIDKGTFIDKKKFLDRYSDIIPGKNRASKRKRIDYFIKNKYNTVNKEKRIKETSVLEAKIIENNSNEDIVKFGVISDTHFNSKYSQITYLNQFYDICVKNNIDTIYHCGDIDDGEQMRVGHAYENYTQGATEHINEIIKNYPYRKNITTYFITGNHDASFRKSCGLDIGNIIESRRQDLKYLGKDVVTIDLNNNITMMLRHPWDGTAYALSYKPQKIIEAMRDSLIKPDILVIGHYHKMEYLKYLGIHCLQAGCFQGNTSFTLGKGIRISIGGWIVTIKIKDGKIESFLPEAITFNEDIKDDYKNYL